MKYALWDKDDELTEHSATRCSSFHITRMKLSLVFIMGFHIRILNWVSFIFILRFFTFLFIAVLTMSGKFVVAENMAFVFF